MHLKVRAAQLAVDRMSSHREAKNDARCSGSTFWTVKNMKKISTGKVSTISKTQFWKGNPPSFTKQNPTKAVTTKPLPIFISAAMIVASMPSPARLWIKNTFIILALLSCGLLVAQRARNTNMLSSMFAQRKNTESVPSPNISLNPIIILHVAENSLITTLILQCFRLALLWALIVCLKPIRWIHCYEWKKKLKASGLITHWRQNLLLAL